MYEVIEIRQKPDGRVYRNVVCLQAMLSRAEQCLRGLLARRAFRLGADRDRLSYRVRLAAGPVEVPLPF